MERKTISVSKDIHKQLSQLKVDLEIWDFDNLFKHLLQNQKH